jgi:hypothetical protein
MPYICDAITVIDPNLIRPLRPGIIISLLFLLTAFYGVGQDFPDRIITEEGDTIQCRITHVNAKHIYYYYSQRGITRPDDMPLLEVSDYTIRAEKAGWKPKSGSSDQGSARKAKWGYGVGVVQQFNMPIMHTSVVMNVWRKGSIFYAGPQYTLVYKEYSREEGVTRYSQNSPGVNFGFRQVFKTRNEIFNLFVQMDFSVYESEYWYYVTPYSEIKSEDQWIVENNVSVGLNYRVTDKVELNTGYGMGSTAGFFLMFEEVIPHFFVGLQYNIR